MWLGWGTEVFEEKMFGHMQDPDQDGRILLDGSKRNTL
jgi:hypothetical protein